MNLSGVGASCTMIRALWCCPQQRGGDSPPCGVDAGLSGVDRVGADGGRADAGCGIRCCTGA
jgi:hypothetical protein